MFYADEECEEEWNLPDEQDISIYPNGVLFERRWKQPEGNEVDVDAYSPSLIPKRGLRNSSVAVAGGRVVDLGLQSSISKSRPPLTRSSSMPTHKSAPPPLIHQRSFITSKNKLFRGTSVPLKDKSTLKMNVFNVETDLSGMSDRSYHRSQANESRPQLLRQNSRGSREFVHAYRFQQQHSISESQDSEKNKILLFYPSPCFIVYICI